MTKQVPWNRIILDEFINLAMLTKEEEMVVRMRINGMTVEEQANALNMSVSSINRIIKRTKAKYDKAVKFSKILPPRKRRKSDLYEEH